MRLHLATILLALLAAGCITAPPAGARPGKVAVSASQPAGDTMEVCVWRNLSRQGRDLWKGLGPLEIRFVIEPHGAVSGLDVLGDGIPGELEREIASAAARCPWIPARDAAGQPVAQEGTLILRYKPKP
jgi:hypothetical protein